MSNPTIERVQKGIDKLITYCDDKKKTWTTDSKKYSVEIESLNATRDAVNNEMTTKQLGLKGFTALIIINISAIIFGAISSGIASLDLALWITIIGIIVASLNGLATFGEVFNAKRAQALEDYLGSRKTKLGTIEGEIKNTTMIFLAYQDGITQFNLLVMEMNLFSTVNLTITNVDTILSMLQDFTKRISGIELDITKRIKDAKTSAGIVSIMMESKAPSLDTII